MKHFARKVVAATVNNDIIWPVLKPFLTVCNFAYFSRKHPNDISKIYSNLFKDVTVLNGPFKGMKYPSLDAVGSVVFPKLLGSYEKELHETIEELTKNQYSEILDIGCAEGYYAVGLGMLFPDARVFAYDIDSRARKLCAVMANLNDRKSQINIKEYCSSEELEKFNFTGRGLIVCDCEGFEMQLFTKANLKNLSNCDIIIEVHDFVDIEISGYLTELFKETHAIKVIKSIDDIEKAKTYKYVETASASLDDKLRLFREWRPSILEWMICTPKT